MTAKIQKQTWLKQCILKQLYYNRALSFAELCARTNKSLPVVSDAVNALLKDEYIIEHGLAPSTGGRRPATYRLNAQKNRYIVAVAVDQLETKVRVYNLNNKCLYEVESLKLDLACDEGVLQQLIAFIKQTLGSNFSKKEILGLGIAMPGVYNLKSGTNHTFFPHIENLPRYISESLGVPVFIDNDSRAIAMAELNFGAAKGYKDVMVLNIGWGIGLGMIVDGDIFKGHNGYAGEFSHIPLANSDHLCSCGKRGCLEVDSSLLVLVEKARQEMNKGEKSKLETLFRDTSQLAGEHLLDAAKSGDPLAISLLAEGGRIIGKGLATLIHIMNPERIILSGRGASVGKIWLAPIHQAINEYCIPRLGEQTSIIVSEMKDAQLVGAASLVIESCTFT